MLAKTVSLLATVSLVCIAGYVVICITLYLLQERFIFFPEKLPRDFQFSFENPFEELSLEVDGAVLNALYFRVPSAKGVVLYFHGNAGSLRDWGHVAENFLQYDHDILIVDYRGYGKSSGTITSEKAILLDAVAAYDFLQQQVAEKDIVVYGRSVGSAPATYLATVRHPRTLILEAPFYSLQDMVAQQLPFAVPSPLLKYTFRNDLWAADVQCPVHIFHGTRDEVIPFTSGERLVTRFPGDSRLITIDGGMHNNLEQFPLYHEELRTILAPEIGAGRS